MRFNYDVCFSYLKKGKFEEIGETPYQKPLSKTLLIADCHLLFIEVKLQDNKYFSIGGATMCLPNVLLRDP